MPVPVVVGAGAVGTWLAVRFTHKNRREAVLFARPERAAWFHEHGVHVETLPGTDPDGTGGWMKAGTGMRVVSDPHELPEEALLVFAVRAYQTREAAQMLKESGVAPWGVVTLQNGLGNAEALGEVFSPHRVAAGTTSHGLLWIEGAGVRQTGWGEITLGPWTEEARPMSEEGVRLLESGGLPVDRVSDPRPALWRKVAVNAAINPPTALHGVENGALLDDGPLERGMRTATREVARVAQAEGIALSEDAAEAAAVRVARQTARNRSSMLQALQAGRPLETDAITGEVVRRARQHGIAVPVNEALLQHLQKRMATGA